MENIQRARNIVFDVRLGQLHNLNVEMEQSNTFHFGVPAGLSSGTRSKTDHLKVQLLCHHPSLSPSRIFVKCPMTSPLPASRIYHELYKQDQMVIEIRNKMIGKGQYCGKQ